MKHYRLTSQGFELLPDHMQSHATHSFPDNAEVRGHTVYLPPALTVNEDGEIARLKALLLMAEKELRGQPVGNKIRNALNLPYIGADH